MTELQGWIIIGLLSLYVFIWLVFGIFGVEARPRRDSGQRGAAEAEGRGAQRRIRSIRRLLLNGCELDLLVTSSAVVSSDEGTVRPGALTALRLITSSNLVGCWIGRSAGFRP